MVCLLECFVSDRLFGHDALDEAGAVPHGQKMDFAARTPIMEPALERDGLPGVLCDVLNVCRHDCASVRSNRCRARRASSRTVSGALVFASSIRYVPS